MSTSGDLKEFIMKHCDLLTISHTRNPEDFGFDVEVKCWDGDGRQFATEFAEQEPLAIARMAMRISDWKLRHGESTI